MLAQDPGTFICNFGNDDKFKTTFENNTISKPLKPIGLDQLRIGWMDFITRFDSAHDYFAETLTLSFEYYNVTKYAYQKYRNDAIKRIADAHAQAWEKMLIMGGIDSTAINDAIKKLSDAVEKHRTEIDVKYIEYHAEVNKIMNDFTSVMDTMQMAQILRELIKCESLATSQLLALAENLGIIIDHTYAGVEKALDGYEETVSKLKDRN